MNILITGGLGHIGSHLIANLEKIKKLNQVYIIDNNSNNNNNSVNNNSVNDNSVYDNSNNIDYCCDDDYDYLSNDDNYSESNDDNYSESMEYDNCEKCNRLILNTLLNYGLCETCLFKHKRKLKIYNKKMSKK